MRAEPNHRVAPKTKAVALYTVTIPIVIVLTFIVTGFAFTAAFESDCAVGNRVASHAQALLGRAFPIRADLAGGVTSGWLP